jgi:hypothetical protein
MRFGQKSGPNSTTGKEIGKNDTSLGSRRYLPANGFSRSMIWLADIPSTPVIRRSTGSHGEG